MRLKVIACEVITRQICWSVARSPHVVDMEFTSKNAHEISSFLQDTIQEKIDATPEGIYDAILLGYGLCGNGTVGLKARHTPLILPRAHDCCTLFLGSRSKFKEHFSENPSQPFTSVGYMERGDNYIHTSDLGKTLGLNREYEEYVDLYGEENAQYIMDTLNPTFDLAKHGEKVVFIRVPETESEEWAARFHEKATQDGKEFVQLDGSIQLIHNLINGNWTSLNDANSDSDKPMTEFIKVLPGHQIEGVYDWDEICRSNKIKERD